jgi:hypothetical protein
LYVVELTSWLKLHHPHRSRGRTDPVKAGTIGEDTTQLEIVLAILSIAADQLKAENIMHRAYSLCMNTEYRSADVFKAQCLREVKVPEWVDNALEAALMAAH